MSIKSEPVVKQTLHNGFAVGALRFCDNVGGSLVEAFSAGDDISDFDALLRQLDDLPDVPLTRN